MTESDELHKLSDSIYRHLEKSFSPGLRNIIATGKAYHESLGGITSHATAYIEALLKLGHSCKTMCKGSTQAIGEALFAIADTHRQIQVQVEEANKALWTEFLLPLENKVESQYREIVQGHKRYSQGHKSVFSSYEKAENTLRKVRKKSKSKRSVDDHGAVESIKEWSEKLTKFRSQGLKLALLEERKHYCYLLDKCCGIAKISADNNLRAATLLNRSLATWQSLCSDPMVLPPESSALVALHTDGNVHMSPIHNGHLVAAPKSRDYANQLASHSLTPNSNMHEGQDGEKDMTLMTALPPSSQSPHVRALYNHSADGDNQLSFNEGDVIVLIGEKSEGWHYGVNTTTNRYGWFPLSFVEPVDKIKDTGQNSGVRQRHRSVGDLRDSVGHVDNADPRGGRRPLSMYGNPPLTQHPEPETSSGLYANESFHANKKDGGAISGGGAGGFSGDYHGGVPPSPPLPPPPIPSTLPPPPNIPRSSNINIPRTTANNYSSPLHVPPRPLNPSLPQPPPPPPLPNKSHHHHFNYDPHQQSPDHTGSDTYQEAGGTALGDGKPDFWVRGIQNNSMARPKHIPHADYDDDPGYRTRAQAMGGYHRI